MKIHIIVQETKNTSLYAGASSLKQLTSWFCDKKNQRQNISAWLTKHLLAGHVPSLRGCLKNNYSPCPKLYTGQNDICLSHGTLLKITFLPSY